MRSVRARLSALLAPLVCALACAPPAAPPCDPAIAACAPDAGPVDPGTPDAGAVDAGAPDAGHCAPDAPGAVTALPGDGSATVSWAAGATRCGVPVTSYTVVASPGGASALAAGERTVVITGLANGTAYTFVVTAHDANGPGEASAPSPAVVPRTVPAAPSALVATGGLRSVALTWEPPVSNGGAAVTGYVVRRGSAGEPLAEAGRTDADALEFTDPRLDDGVVYDYEVVATNAAGDGPAATAEAITRPGQPTSLVATVSGTTVTLAWDALRGAAKYELLRSQAGGSLAPLATVAAPAYVDAGLAGGTRYDYAVRATNAAGAGPTSAPAPAVTAPAAPGDLQAVADLTTGMPRIRLTWASSTTADSYEVLRSPTSGTGFVHLATTTSYALVDEDVSAETAYFYVVRASSTAGTSPDSAEATATTPALPPLVTTLASAPLTRDPAVLLTLASCVGRAAVFVGEGTAPAPSLQDWQACTTVAGAIRATLAPEPQGTRTLRLWARDHVGKIEGPVTASVVFDTLPPALTLAAVGGPFRGGARVAFGWRATEANPGAAFTFEVSTDDGATWGGATSVPAPGGPLADAAFTASWTAPATDAAKVRFRVSFTDIAGNTTSATTPPFVVDASAPTVSSLAIAGGAATTTSNTVGIALRGSDALTRITHFCLKYVNRAPAADDACWTAVDGAAPGLVAAKSLDLAAFPFRIGYLRGDYTVYGWLRDEVGNASALAAPAGCPAAGGPDCATITFRSPEPPVVSRIQATASDAPASPPSAADLTVSAGADVFVKWQASDAAPLPAGAIALSYTADGTNEVPIATGLPNAAGPGCTISGALTGCFRWSPGSAFPAGPFTVRIAVTSAEGVTTRASAPVVNGSGLVRILAGNTDPGLGASAKAAVFFNDQTDAEEDPQSFAVTSTGSFYFRDARRGILVVSPQDGLQRLFIPTTGTMSPDGPLATATLQRPVRLAVDAQDRLLVLDHDRIRRYDPATGTFATIVGGGTSVGDNVAPLAAQIAVMPLQIFKSKTIAFAALPNGDVVFQDKPTLAPSATGYRLRIYDAAQGRVRGVVPNGTGIGPLTTQDVAACQFVGTVFAYDPATSAPTYFGATAYNTCGANRGNFDPVTGTARQPALPASGPSAWVTGMDGNAHLFGTTHGYGTDNAIYRLDAAQNRLVKLVGTGTNGNCPDDTPALSCAISPRDVFVTAQGQLYFMDRARLRTLDKAGNVVTVMGQSLAAGDGGPALVARFGSASSLDVLDSGEIIVSDSSEKRYRQFAVGGNIRTIAGNGTDGPMNRTTAADAQPLVFGGYYLADDIAANPATGELVVSNNAGFLVKLNRTTGLWENLAGGGSTLLSGADGLVGSQINIGGAVTRALGFDGARYLLSITGNAGGPLYKLYAAADGRQTGFLGVNGTEGSPSFCADGTAGSACPVPSPLRNTHARATWDAFASRWVLLGSGTAAIRTMTAGGAIGTLTTLASPARSFAYRHDAAVEVVYYCSTADDRLHRKDLKAGTDAAYAWPVAAVKCTGRALVYEPRRGSLVFPFEQNGLVGVAEYTAP